MYKVTKTYRRPNTNVPFFEDVRPNRDKSLIVDRYLKTGKLVSYSTTESSDGLTRTYERNWLDEDSFLEFISDQPVFKAHIGPRETYNRKNGIVVEEN